MFRALIEMKGVKNKECFSFFGVCTFSGGEEGEKKNSNFPFLYKGGMLFFNK